MCGTQCESCQLQCAEQGRQYMYGGDNRDLCRRFRVTGERVARMDEGEARTLIKSSDL